MYHWYLKASICYAYLSDIPNRWMVVSPWMDDFDRKGLFSKSRWFTRGWTLQELIAPPIVEFYAQDWSEIGTKRSLKTVLAGITGIDIRVLEGESPTICNVAERMSWAANRRTTRVEDSAYCLLGIFNVNIPLIYGEGKKALHRLQQEVLNTTNDDTLLAWGLNDANALVFRAVLPPTNHLSAADTFQSIKDQVITKLMGKLELSPLAESISSFKASDRSSWTYKSLGRLPQQYDTSTIPPTMTRRGLQAVLYVKDCGNRIFLACVNHSFEKDLLCLCLSRIDDSSDIFSRLGGTGLRSWFALVPAEMIGKFEQRTIIISKPAERAVSSHPGRMMRQSLRELQPTTNDAFHHFILRMSTSSHRVTYHRAFLGLTLPEEGLEFLDFVHLRWGTGEPVIVVVGNFWGRVLPISDSIFQTPSGPLYSWHSSNMRSSQVSQVCLALTNRYPAPRVLVDRMVEYFDSYAVSVSWRLLPQPGGSEKVVVEINSWEATSDFQFSASKLLSGET